jgi:hypothetical protein
MGKHHAWMDVACTSLVGEPSKEKRTLSRREEAKGWVPVLFRFWLLGTLSSAVGEVTSAAVGLGFRARFLKVLQSEAVQGRCYCGLVCICLQTSNLSSMTCCFVKHYQDKCSSLCAGCLCVAAFDHCQQAAFTCTALRNGIPPGAMSVESSS